MNSLDIFGAGFAGLLAGQLFRQAGPQIYEASKALPDNHEAVLRFRTDAIEKFTGVDLKKIQVRKGMFYLGKFITEPNLFLANMYSQKVSGIISERSIWNLDDCTRYLSTGGLTEKLSKDLNIMYSTPITKLVPKNKQDSKHRPIISTIPMPSLMKIVGWKDIPDFNFSAIWTVRASVTGVDKSINQTVYYPGDEPCYRATLSQGKLIAEFMQFPLNGTDIVGDILKTFGIDTVVYNTISHNLVSTKEQKFGKISSIDDKVRKAFMYHMTQEYGVYSLGRFATWRNLLLDDVIDDCIKIKTMINSDEYENNLMR